MSYTVTKLKDARGRRITGYRARLENPNPDLYPSQDLYADGVSPDAARAMCDARLQRVLNVSPRIETEAGFVFIAYPTWDGIAHVLVCRDGHKVEGFGSATISAAITAMRHHAAQMLYPDSVAATLPNTQESREDFARWAKWQESYARLRAEGKTDQEAHRLAAGY